MDYLKKNTYLLLFIYYFTIYSRCAWLASNIATFQYVYFLAREWKDRVMMTLRISQIFKSLRANLTETFGFWSFSTATFNGQLIHPLFSLNCQKPTFVPFFSLDIRSPSFYIKTTHTRTQSIPNLFKQTHNKKSTPKPPLAKQRKSSKAS